MASQQVQHLPTGLAPRLPRGASLRVVIGQRLTSLGHGVRLFLGDIGCRRANCDLLAVAERWRDTNPTLSRELRSYARGGSSY